MTCKSSAPQPPTMHTKYVAASVSDMVQEWYSGKSDVPHMTADLFERRISRFQALEPAQPDPLGAAWMREQAAELAVNRHSHWHKLGSDCLVDDDVSACADIADAIRAIPDPAHADLLAQAMKLPEIAALVEAFTVAGPIALQDYQSHTFILNAEETANVKKIEYSLAALVQP